MHVMSTPAIATIIKMVETLPEELQEQVVEHIRAYIAEIENEKQWNESFNRTKSNLVAAAQKAKEEIAAGLSAPMDYEQL
jgi:glycerate-2-kinase